MGFTDKERLPQYQLDPEMILPPTYIITDTTMRYI